MIEPSRIALNRIVCPRLEIEAFLELAAAVGLKDVELRNDLPGGGITDGRSPAEVATLLKRRGQKVLLEDMERIRY